MKWLIASIVFLLCALMPYEALAKTLTVAVIDTGIDASSNDKLCKFGHKSFVDKSPLVDNHGHGTHIAGLIRKEAGLLDYCIVSIKYYSDSNSGKQNLANMVAALRYVNNIKVDFINISGGGPESDDGERTEILRALFRKATVVVAAGNEHDDLDVECNYFPACYSKRIIVVGNNRYVKIPSWVKSIPNVDQFFPNANQSTEGAMIARAPSSNYGKYVTRWEIGTELDSTLPGGQHGKMSGTSQATGVATGKLIRERFL